VLKDRSAFQTFLINEVGIKNPPNFGIYLHQISSFVTYEGSGNGTFAHEIMHPLIRENLPHTPKWAEEGIPSIFEKCFGYYNNNELVLNLGFQNPWRINELGENILNLDLEQIVLGRYDYGTSEKRMVSIFLYTHGMLKKYINLIKNNKKNGYNTFLEAAFNLQMYEIEPLWTQYLKDVYNSRSTIQMIPASEVFETKEEFNKFMEDNNLKQDSYRQIEYDGK
jgi:hypothetical protein